MLILRHDTTATLSVTPMPTLTRLHVRASIDRWRQMRDALRTLESCARVNYMIDLTTCEGHEAAEFFERRIASLQRRLTEEGSRLTIEGLQVDLRARRRLVKRGKR